MDFPHGSSIPSPLIIIAQEFIESRRRGEWSLVSDWIERHPEWSEQISGLFPTLEMMEEARTDQSDLAEGRRVSRGAHPDRLGDYQILHWVGRGGMGDVYEAIHESLRCHVALKVMRPRFRNDEDFLEKFYREARLAAGLHHTNIVPVFNFGEHEGVCYYAMQFIPGRAIDKVLDDVKHLRETKTAPSATNANLAETLPQAVDPGTTGDHVSANPSPIVDRDRALSSRDRPDSDFATGFTVQTSVPCRSAIDSADDPSNSLFGKDPGQYYREVARIGLQVAEALAYAHSRKVLHLDVKPANLLLDALGNAWITDFGLARLEEDELSRAGDVTGTLRYMAPERFVGESTRSADVFALGATLYEMLTLRPAFDESEYARLVNQIRNETPTTPRQIDPRIPRDLEAIVLKALAKDPADRFSTAREMALGLRLFLENRTIPWRRTPLHERTSRWCQRNPALIVLVMSATLSLAVLSIVSAVWLNHVREEAQTALWESRLSQAKAWQFSRRVGQRFEGLQALHQAARIRPAPELRDQAIACLALPDLQLDREWNGWLPDTVNVAFDPSLERYARRDAKGAVSVRSVRDDHEIRSLPGAGAGPGVDLFVLTFSPDGRFLAVTYAPGHALKVWRLDRAEPVLIDPGPVPSAVGFSPDGSRIAVGHNDGRVVVSDLTSGKAVLEWKGSPPRRLAYHPDGRRLAVCRVPPLKGVEIRDARTGALAGLVPHESPSQLAWSADGGTLAVCGDDSRIVLFDSATYQQTVVCQGHRNRGLTASFSPDGDLLASTGWEGVVRIWDTRTGRQLLSLPCGTDDLRFSADGLRLAAGIDRSQGKLRIWRATPGREYRSLVRSPTIGPGIYQQPHVSPDGRFLTAGMNDGVGLWDLRTAKPLAFLAIGGANCPLFEPTGGLLTNGPSGVFRWPVAWDGGTMRVGPPRRLAVPSSNCQMARSGDGHVVAIANYRGAVVFDPDFPSRQLQLSPQIDVRYVAVSPDGRWAATGNHNGNEVGVWDARSGRLVQKLKTGRWAKVAFSPNGKWLATSGDVNQLREVGSWDVVRQFDGGAAPGIVFSPDSRTLAVGTSPGVVQLIDAETGEILARLADPDQNHAQHCCFSPDGSQFVVSSPDAEQMHVWDLRAIREQLAAMGLDWRRLPFPKSPAAPPPPTVVQVDLGELNRSGRPVNLSTDGVEAADDQGEGALADESSRPRSVSPARSSATNRLTP